MKTVDDLLDELVNSTNMHNGEKSLVEQCDTCKAARPAIHDRIREIVRDAVQRERTRCAEVAESFCSGLGESYMQNRTAKAIERGIRGTTTPVTPGDSDAK